LWNSRHNLFSIHTKEIELVFTVLGSGVAAMTVLNAAGLRGVFDVIDHEVIAKIVVAKTALQRATAMAKYVAVVVIHTQ
jgi:hypothetical protein